MQPREDQGNVAVRIEDLVNELEERKKDLERFIKAKPIYHATKDLKLRIAKETLRERGQGTSVGLIKDLIGTHTADEEANLKQIEMTFKAKVHLIEATKAQLNGWQSINKHISNT